MNRRITIGHKYLLFECFPPLDLLLADDSDLRRPALLEFLRDEVRDPAFNLPTWRLTFPMVVCGKEYGR